MESKSQKKFGKFFRACVIAVLSTVILALIGLARLWDYPEPKASTALVNFFTILGCSWLASVVIAATNKGIFMAKAEENRNKNNKASL